MEVQRMEKELSYSKNGNAIKLFVVNSFVSVSKQWVNQSK
jgi:hypothetical protein